LNFLRTEDPVFEKTLLFIETGLAFSFGETIDPQVSFIEIKSVFTPKKKFLHIAKGKKTENYMD
jgi:hypothetical protein